MANVRCRVCLLLSIVFHKSWTDAARDILMCCFPTEEQKRHPSSTSLFCSSCVWGNELQNTYWASLSRQAELYQLIWSQPMSADGSPHPTPSFQLESHTRHTLKAALICMFFLFPLQPSFSPACLFVPNSLLLCLSSYHTGTWKGRSVCSPCCHVSCWSTQKRAKSLNRHLDFFTVVVFIDNPNFSVTGSTV